MSTSSRAVPGPPGAALRFVPHLTRRAAAYFDDFGAGPVRVHLRSSSDRRLSQLHEFELASAERTHQVLVKVPSGPLGGASAADVWHGREMRRSSPALESKSQLEYATLSGMHALFDRLRDPRFGTIRPLELMRENALVMEKVTGSGLSRVVASSNRLLRRSADAEIGRAFRNAGAWLKAWHQLATLSHTQPRRTTRAEFVTFIAELASHLTHESGDTASFENARVAACRAAGGVLPPELPLGTSHGDYAPRNILVGARGQVTVLDTLGRWKTPIYGDLGNFLFALKATRLQVYTRGLAFTPSTLAAWERSFLCGYFDQEPVPLAAIRLFEIRALLDKWVSVCRRQRHAAGLERVREQYRARAWDRFLRRYLLRLLSDLDETRPMSV